MSLYYFKHIYFKNLSKLEKTNAALSIAKKQKEKILNTVAHDLRTPISNIAGISQLILADAQFTKEQKDLVALIVHATNASLTLINDLLENSDAHIQASLLAPVDLNALIRQYAPLLSISASEKHCFIEYHLTEMELPVYVDSGRIERVINNLVSNALKFSPPDSVISINTEKDKEYAILVVKDNGIGIPSENHQNIFELYTHAKRKGTAGEQSFGMGLSICKQIVEQHGGNIYLESEVGKGSSFMVTLPLYDN
jgi:two-component system, OmpR family, sensor histidine kinase VicK